MVGRADPAVRRTGRQGGERRAAPASHRWPRRCRKPPRPNRSKPSPGRAGQASEEERAARRPERDARPPCLPSSSATPPTPTGATRWARSLPSCRPQSSGDKAQAPTLGFVYLHRPLCRTGRGLAGGTARALASRIVGRLRRRRRGRRRRGVLRRAGPGADARDAAARALQGVLRRTAAEARRAPSARSCTPTPARPTWPS